MIRTSFWLIAALVVAGRSHAQAASDSLLGRLIGEWRMSGQVRGKPVAYALAATWVLDHKYVELHMTDLGRPARYEARVFVGADTAPAHVLVHWLDGFGAAYSVPAGAGAIRGDTLEFTFQYSDGPFRDVWIYRGPAIGWHFRLEKGDGHGGWRPFAEYEVIPAKGTPR